MKNGILRKILIFPLVVLIRAYQVLLSPLLGQNCRFTPTCSRYTLQALQKHGLLKGSVIGAWRIMRCNPWGGSGYDPVPDHPVSFHDIFKLDTRG